METPKDFYSITEVAEKLNLSQKTIRRFIAARILSSNKISGVYKIPHSALVSFLDNRNSIFQTDLFGNKILIESKSPTKQNRRTDNVNWCNIESVWGNPSRSKLTFIDIFSGAGGITKGFEMAGLKAVCGLDWFKEAGLTYKRNFHHPYIEGDIKDVKVKKKFYEVVRGLLGDKSVSIIAGGFPCQGFSIAGNRIVDDPRNSLYVEMLEIVKTLKPDFVIMENVVGLRSMLQGKVEGMILQDFLREGYKINVTTLNAVHYYVPQRRERVIFIGNRIGKINYHPLPLLNENSFKTIRETIEDLMHIPVDKGFNHVPTVHRLDMVEKIKALKEGQSLYGNYSDAWKKCFWDGPSSTIKENHGGVNIHPRLPRVLTAREMARLQSFPDDFIFMGPKNKQLVQIGNAVPPLLAKAIGLSIRYSYGELP